MFRDDEKTHVVEGRRSIAQLGRHARGLGGARALLVTDPGVVAAGHAARAQASLVASGLRVTVFQDVQENPTTEDVDRGLAAVRALEPDIYVAVGGGSAIDAAKGINFRDVCGGPMQDYWGHDKATAPLRPMIAVPTTAGTGSEVQSFALITDAETGRKMACGDRTAAPKFAILDPELSLTMPREVTAITGLDTIAHAVESAVAKPRDAETDGRSLEYACEAFGLAAAALPLVLAEPDDVEARGSMLRASALAGLAIEHAMLGAAHSMANPLTRVHGVPHGLAVGMMLPHVVRFNASEPAAREVYESLARAICVFDDDPVDALADRLDELLRATGLPTRLTEHGVTSEGIGALATEASEQWTAGFNPRSVSTADFRTLLTRAL